MLGGVDDRDSGPVDDGPKAQSRSSSAADWTPDQLARQAAPAGAGLSRRRRPSAGVEARLRRYPPLVFAGEARRLKDRAGRGRRRQGLPAAGRRLRRELRRVHRQQHPRHLPRAAADGGGADLRRRRAGGEGRPHGRPVRQAALVATPRRSGRRRRCRPIAATSSTASSSRRRRAMPDPQRMVQAYSQSAATLEPAARLRPGRLRRSAPRSIAGTWTSSPTRPQGERYRDAGRPARPRRSTSWRACGIDLRRRRRRSRETELLHRHEALLLPYEEALTRVDSTTGDWYDCSAHMLWIGDRTRQLDGAHVEFLRGVKNPIGMKCGPTPASPTICCA